MPKESISNKRDIANGGLASDLYTRIPCKIGYNYFRVQVDGTILPCCVIPRAMGSTEKQNIDEIWLSKDYEKFREKTKKINIEHFHRTDPKWSFCQQCPHKAINRQADQYEELFDSLGKGEKKTRQTRG